MRAALLEAADPGASEWARADESAVRLVSATAAVGTATELRVGLEFALQPGWKTYWRSPGDAGFPVTVDWAGSRNVAAADMSWPVPHRFSLFGLETFGYKDQVVLPIAVRPQTPGQPVAPERQGRAISSAPRSAFPMTRSSGSSLPAGPAAPTDNAQLINRFHGAGARRRRAPRD